MKLSRRDFIKGSLAGAAAAALTSIPGVAYADKTGILSEEKTYEEGQYSFEIPPRRSPRAKSPRHSTSISASSARDRPARSPR